MLEIFDLKTVIAMSLLTDRRVEESELPPGETYRRGWWGDALSESGSKFGSKLWLLSRHKFNPELLELAKTYTLEALDWITHEGYAESIEVSCEGENWKLLIHVTIHSKHEHPKKLKVDLNKKMVMYAV